MEGIKLDTIDFEVIKELNKNIDIKKNHASTQSKLVQEVNKIVASTKTNIEGDTVEKAINWCCYKDIWLKNETHSLKNEFYNYERGDIIISLDLGALNIGTEIRYPHPCVVLYDNGEDWIVVAPITAAQIDKITGEPIIHEFEVYVEKQKKAPKNSREFYFKKKSVIQVDQIYRVSKHRAINKKRKKIRVDLLNQIDNIILRKYTPKKHRLLEEMKELNKELWNKLKEENRKNELLIEEIDKNKELIKNLEEKILRLENK